MRRMIVLLLVLTFTVLSSYHLVEAVELEGYMIAAENQYLTLFFNEDTTEIAVYDHRTEQFWHSNPVNRRTVETIARGSAKDALGAQLRIVYYAPGDVQRSMDNYNDSIVFGQFEVDLLDDGIRVEYVLGKEWEDQYYLPLIVEQTLFENEFFDQLDRTQQRTISGLYALVELAEADEGVKPTVGDKYVINACEGGLTSREQRTINTVFLDHLIKFKSNLSKADDVKDADLQPFLGKPFYILKQRDRDMLPWDKTAIIDIAREVGFDPYIIGEGHEIYNMESGEPNTVIFTVPIEYRLENDNLVVSILTEGIKYPIQVRDAEGQLVTYPLVQIGLLPYFGAAEIGSDGYMFVPDGSGSLIHFDNEKTHLATYSRRIYGQDYAVSVPTSLISTHSSYLPVFGIKNFDNALFGIIEEGASITRINADVSGRRISYNTIYPSFEIIERTISSLSLDDAPRVYGSRPQWINSGGGAINVYQESMYGGKIRVRYAFLTNDKADYVGMAHYYQDYLIDKGYLSRINPKEDIPLMLELIGAVPDRQPILGIPRNVIIPMTTYKEAEAIISKLLENKIDNLSVSYLGWMKNGFMSGYPTKVRLESKLGTEADLKDLIELTNSNQVNFYPSVDFMFVYRDTWFDGFRSTRDAARSLTRNVAVAGGYLLSPARLGQLIDKYLQSQAEYDFSGIQLWDLGNQLHGDYRRGSNITREETIKIVQDQLAKIEKNNLDIQTYGANEYALPFVTSILGVPLEHSGIDLTDESVPFMPIVLHGFVDYAGEALNYAGSPTDCLLKMLETGAKPYFRVFNEDPSVLKGTFYDSFYSGQFDELFDEILTVYNLLNDAFKDVQNEKIVSHCKLSNNVFETVYENGQSVIVNYNEEEVSVKDMKISPKGFVVLKGVRVNEQTN